MRKFFSAVRVWQWVGLLLLFGASLGLFLWRRGSVPIEPEANVPPPQTMPLRDRVVKQIVRESPEELLDKLVEKYDDLAGAVLGARLPFGVNEGTYVFAQSVVPKLSRVRRIIQEHQRGAPAPIEKVRTLLTDAVRGYQAFYKKVGWLQDERGRKRITDTPFPEWDELHRRFTVAPVAVYLLGEFKSFDSLPLLGEVYETETRCPVSRLFVFMVMHRLALQHPRKDLSPEAVKALDEYIAAIGDAIPPVTTRGLPSWDAPVTEFDVRATVMGKKLDLSKMPTTEIVEYPGSAQKYEDVYKVSDNQTHGLDPKVKGWFARLKKFVRLAYPNP